jgi:hypothetical protein
MGVDMHFYIISLCAISFKRFLSAIIGITIIWVLLSTACVGQKSDHKGQVSKLDSNSVAAGHETAKEVAREDVNASAADNNGPTILLGYSREEFKANPISSFMYFVPLISPTRVDRETSADNEQQAGIISYKRKVTSRSFNVVCEFEILGKGFHKNTFDAPGMIAAHTDMLKKGQSLTNMLDYIKFEGEGFGRIEVKGTMTGSTPITTEVNMQFNARGHKSPVTVGLYDVKPKDGQYTYENRSLEFKNRIPSSILKAPHPCSRCLCQPSIVFDFIANDVHTAPKAPYMPKDPTENVFCSRLNTGVVASFR